MGIIYKLTSPGLEKHAYIGQTIHSLEHRKYGHANGAKFHKLRGETKSGYCVALCNAINKYGFENFETEILIECDDSMLDIYEREMIKKYNTLSPNGYNLTSGGAAGCTFSEETRIKMGHAISFAIIDSIDKYRKNNEAKGCVKHIQFITRRGVRIFRIENHPLCKLKEFGSKTLSNDILKANAEKFIEELERTGIPYKKNENPYGNGISKSKNGYTIHLQNEGEPYRRCFENTELDDSEKLLLAQNCVNEIQEIWKMDAVQRLNVCRLINDYII